MRRAFACFVSWLATALVHSSPALAGEHLGWLTLTLEVTAPTLSCRVAVDNNLSFGTIFASTSSQTPGQGALLVNCTQGAEPALSIGNGANHDGVTRRLASSGNYLPYTLRHPSGVNFDTCSSGNTEWTLANALGLSSLYASSGGAKSVFICGYAHATSGSDYAEGSYADSVLITVSY